MIKVDNSIFLKKSFRVESKIIFNLFSNGTVFKLTGADEIKFDFRESGDFFLSFKHRGKISGRFLKISKEEIILSWNVEGFDRPSEINTDLKIIFKDDKSNGSILTLVHSKIMYNDSAVAKHFAWTEILNDIEKKIS